MTTEEKIRLIEKILREKPNSLKEDTKIRTLESWDSLNILSLQVELSAMNPGIQFDSLYSCDTVGEICDMF